MTTNPKNDGMPHPFANPEGVYGSTPQNKVEGWEEEFDQFVNYFGSKDRQAIRPKFHENPQAIKDFIRNLLLTQSKAKEGAIQDIIRMANELESDCNKDGDKGTEQWRLFKVFRNTIRDKYLTPPDTTISSNE